MHKNNFNPSAIIIAQKMTSVKNLNFESSSWGLKSIIFVCLFLDFDFVL